MRLFEQREAAVAADDPARRRLLEVEGSVLLHIDMAAKHDAELGQVWVVCNNVDCAGSLTEVGPTCSATLASTAS